MKKKNEHPLPGVLYQITGGTGEKCLSNGNTLAESIIINCDICNAILFKDDYKIFNIPPDDDFIRVCNECTQDYK